MNSIQSLQILFASYLKEQDFFSDPKELYEPIVYTMNMGGKRLRPVLMLLACDMYGGDLSKAKNPAVGIEMFHNFTLVHDDIMDKAPIRRNRETVYKKWNTNIGILSGDTMFAIAFKYMMKVDDDLKSRVMALFNSTAIEVCEGQQYDLNYEEVENVTINDYLKMIKLKTGVLLGASLATGAIIARASEEQQQHIYDFGLNTGMVFQLVDDLLDTFGDETTFGKRPGGDIHENKKTFLYLKAYELANSKQKAAMDHLLFSSSVTPEEKFSGIKAIWEELNIKQHVREKIALYHKKAMTSLEALEANKEQIELLKEYANSLLTRSF